MDSRKVKSKLKKTGESLRHPRRRRRAMAIFWSVVLIPPACLILLLSLIRLGAFGKLPTFEELENPSSNIATELISADGKNLGNFFIENRSYVEFDELSPNLVAALVATEDARFYGHSGIDFIGLTRVAVKTLAFGDRGQGGGSTISQQLAKNLYPRDTVSTSGVKKAGKLVISKLKEWITAVMLEYNYTKDEIIAMYLNIVEYGSNAYGIKAASQTFFGKTPAELDVPEAAMLIAVINAPTRYSPVRNKDRALARRNLVIGRMSAAGFLTDEQAREYKGQPISLNYRPISHNEGIGTYFREMVRLYMTAKEPREDQFATETDYKNARHRWENDPLYGWCDPSKNAKADGTPYNLYRDGLKIYTTVNFSMQKYAEEALLEHMGGVIQPRFNQQRANRGRIFFGVDDSEANKIMTSSILSSERGRAMKRAGMNDKQIFVEFDKPVDMTVFTYAGDRDTTLTPRDSILYYKSILRSGFVSMDPTTGYIQAYVGGPNFRHFKYDMASQGRRQIGSTVKPFIYTFAFDHLGLNPCTMAPNSEVFIEAGSGQSWSPREASKVEYDGVLHPLWWGMARSRNNYSAWIMQQSEPQAVVDLMHKMGISSYIEPVPALCTGTAEVSVSELVASFCTFANRGIYTEPMFVTRIEDKQGNVLASFSPRTSDAISEQTAYTMMVDMLQRVVSQGTGSRLRTVYNITGEVGGKTGTTNNNSDSWFVGVAPKLVGGVWVGGENRAIHFTSGGEGGIVALPIFGLYMKKVYADKSLGISPDDKFIPPLDVVRYDCPAEPEPASAAPRVTNEDDFFQ